MAEPRSRPATYADIEALPPNVVGEIAFGVLHAHPRPLPRHGRAAVRLTGEIEAPFDRRIGGPWGWVFIVEPALHLDDEILVPDLAGWRKERLPKLPDTVGITVAPDWICEILSPSTQRFDRTDKLTIYATAAVRHCWYLDPDAKTLEVLILTAGKWLIAATFKDGYTVAAPPFGVHSFALDVLWPNDAQPAGE